MHRRFAVGYLRVNVYLPVNGKAISLAIGCAEEAYMVSYLGILPVEDDVVLSLVQHTLPFFLVCYDIHAIFTHSVYHSIA